MIKVFNFLVREMNNPSREFESPDELVSYLTFLADEMKMTSKDYEMYSFIKANISSLYYMPASQIDIVTRYNLEAALNNLAWVIHNIHRQKYKVLLEATDKISANTAKWFYKYQNYSTIDFDNAVKRFENREKLKEWPEIEGFLNKFSWWFLGKPKDFNVRWSVGITVIEACSILGASEFIKKYNHDSKFSREAGAVMFRSRDVFAQLQKTVKEKGRFDFALEKKIEKAKELYP